MTPDEVPALLSDFDSDPPTHRKRLREMMLQDPRQFLGPATDALKRDLNSRGAQFVISLLVLNGLIVPCLCEPCLNDAEALEIARAAMQFEPMTDVTIARAVTDLAHHDGRRSFESASRLIRILDCVSDGSRISPILARLLTHSNPALRSKAVLMIGRSSKSVKWVQYRLADPDARTRANAIEALWGTDTAEARELLQSMLRDPNNRVAGNAMLGLHRLGACESVPRIYEMAGHSSAVSRSTAAWVMGKSGDLRYMEVLANMLRDGSPTVRKRAFWALGCLKTVAAQVSQGTPFVITARCLDSGDAGSRRLRVSVVQPPNSNPVDLLPTQFALSEDGQPVTSYRVTSQSAIDPLLVVVIMPRESSEAAARWREAVLECLPLKRPQDSWACMPYTPGAPHSEDRASGEGEGPQFYSAPDRLAMEFGRLGWQPGRNDLWRAVRRALQVDHGALKGRRHLILVNHEESVSTPDDALVTVVQAGRASVQAVCSTPNATIRALCERAGGAYWGGDCASAPDLLRAAYLNLLARYEISYEPVVPAAQRVKLRVWNTEAYGEVVVKDWRP